MSERHAYGGIFHARFEYIREKHGQEGVKKVIEKMVSMGYDGPRTPEEFKIGQKYPFEYLLILLKSYSAIYGENALDKMSRAVAQKKGIVGFFVRWAGEPETLLRKASEYWPNFYDFGRIEGEVLDKNGGVVRGYEVSPDPFFCRSLTHYFAGILDNIRVRNIKVEHTKCIHAGDDHCEWSLRWER